MTTTLPKTIKLQCRRGDTEVAVKDLSSTGIPQNDGGGYRSQMFGARNRQAWDGFCAEDVKGHLTTWSFPREVRKVRDRAEQILEDTIPNQRRSMLRNQRHGLLDQRWVPQIAIGQDVEAPFQRWSKNKRDTVSVAICLDSAVACYQSEELLRSRMVLCAGLASALEFLDYEVAIISGHVQIGSDGWGGGPLPRQDPKRAKIHAVTAKDWNEPFADGGLAHFANTGLRRLVLCWEQQGNGCATSMTDSEWRELTQADILIYIGPKKGSKEANLNSRGLPAGAKLGVHGDDTIRIESDKMSHVDPALDQLGEFFQERFG